MNIARVNHDYVAGFRAIDVPVAPEFVSSLFDNFDDIRFMEVTWKTMTGTGHPEAFQPIEICDSPEFGLHAERIYVSAQRKVPDYN